MTWIILDNIEVIFFIMYITINNQWSDNLFQKKYVDCKRDLGFCIPGFQVYKVSSRKLLKYGKDYGKRLNKTSVEDGKGVFGFH